LAPAGIRRGFGGTTEIVRETPRPQPGGQTRRPDGSRALIDRELYLPKKWTDDRNRCRAAGIGDDVSFATKPQLARQMIGCAVRAGVPFSWVARDKVYGGNRLRGWLEKEEISIQARRITTSPQPPDTAALATICAADIPGHLDPAAPHAPGQRPCQYL